MRITLLRFPTVMPEGQFNVSSVAPPLSLASLAAYAKLHGFPVQVVDSLGEAPENIGTISGQGLKYRGLSLENMLARIQRDVEVLGVSCMFSSQWPFEREAIKALRAAFPGAKIIAGGEHVSALPELVLSQSPGVDVAVIGEGEETFRELAEALSKGADLEGVDGIMFRRNGSLHKTRPRRRITALDDMPPPAWDTVPINNYFQAGLSHGPYQGRTLPLLTSRGCHYSCRFCSNADMWGQQHSRRTPLNVVREIEMNIAKYGARCFEFYDPSPITDKKWLLEFCTLLIERKTGVCWQMAAGTRFEALDEALLALARRSGCRYLGFAPESGSSQTLTELDKRMDLHDFIKTVRSALKQDLGVKANLIIGFPEETRMQILKTLLFQLRLAFLGVSDAPVFLFSPYPGSEYFKSLLRRKVIPGLSDDYFNSLGLNLFLKNRNRYCSNVGPLELSFYQISGTLLFYAVHYLLRPLEFLKAFSSWDSSGTVFEQRLKQTLKTMMRKARGGSR